LKRSERRLTRLVEDRTAALRERSAELELANKALEELATIDALTGLANRRRLDVFLQQEWQRARRTRVPLSLVLGDVDFFKAYNDTYGHPAGDACLVQVAAVLRGTANRATDLTARFGGEEFAVVLTTSDGAGALKVAEMIRERVAALQMPHARAPLGVVTISLGVATIQPWHDTVASLVSACDRALYEAKTLGRNRVAAEAGAGSEASADRRAAQV
jgi:diguanylate cyclase (GGDEF)-like protein